MTIKTVTAGPPKRSILTTLVATRRRRAIVAGAALICAALLWVRIGPIDAALLDERGRTSTVVVDRRGERLYEALSDDGTRSIRLHPDSLPPALVAATVAAEDRRFWSHVGIDPAAIARAARTNLAENRVVEGASTISQQVAKLLLSRQDPHRVRGWSAKLHEMVLALRLEHRFTKRELLAMYLNLAAYGNQIVGAERASRAYFGTSAAMLTPAQAAFLAGLPQRPSGFNPYRSRDAAVNRQRVVLRRMEAAGALSAEQAREAREERLTFTREKTPFLAPHFVEMVVASAGDHPPARIETTLDGELQGEVAGIIESHRRSLERHGAQNVAVVVLHNQTGEWLAWEGSGDHGDREHGGAINGPVSPRQPGSALKPFTYALAFEHGYSPASVLADVPSSFPTAQAGVVYTPRNYDGRYRGPLLARRALAGSENVPAVSLASDVGIAGLLRFLGRAGLTTFDKNAAYYGVGLTLGNAEVRLDELVTAYAAFARGGAWTPSVAVRRDGDHRRSIETLVSPRTAFFITDILSDPEAREYIFGRGGSLELPFPVAVKTGTSQAYHDNWTIGYSRHVTVGVWVGNFDRTPLRNSSGVTGAAPIFHAVMLAAEKRYGAIDTVHEHIVNPPVEVQKKEICALSGDAANAWCPARMNEWVPARASLTSCRWHRLTDQGVIIEWPPEYREWASKHGFRNAAAPGHGLAIRRATDGAAGRPGAAGPSERTRADGFRIVSPPDDATYLMDPTLRREFQTLPLRAMAAAPGTIEWSVNGARVGTSAPDAPLMWPLTPGRHRITARDGAGNAVDARITVR